MNPSTAFARVLVDELCRGGVREAVICPGARNTPLSFALHDADAAGRLRLHVRVDERTAGYLALGLARASGVPVPVAVTSGTAAANLHPAVLEASHTGTPLVVLTADRPLAARGLGSNQQIDQVKLYGEAVRLFAEVETPRSETGAVAYWRALVCRVLASASGSVSGDPGPVQVNVPLREPLVPDERDGGTGGRWDGVGDGGGGDWPESLDGAPGGAAWMPMAPTGSGAASSYDAPARTLVLVGDCSEELATAAAGLAHRRGWPLLAEPITAARAAALDGGMLALGDAGFWQRHLPERILLVGRPTLSRAVTMALRSGVEVDLVPHSPRWADPGSIGAYLQVPGSVRARVLPASTLRDERVTAHDGDFAVAWVEGATTALHAARESLRGEPVLTGIGVAAHVLDALPAETRLLHLGSSSAVRDADLIGLLRGRDCRFLSNRGVAGIDGNVSTALGAALVTGGPAYALVGDLTFLYDTQALMLGPAEPRPDLTVVVANDDGGGVFSLLEAGATSGNPDGISRFQRILGTPTGVDLAALCAATGTAYVRAADVGELAAVMAPAPGLRVIEVPTDRGALRDVHARLREAVASGGAGS